MTTQAVTILGSTGSVGISTLDVISRHPDRYRIHALTGNRSVEAMASQCAKFQPRFAVMADETAAATLSQVLFGQGLPTRVLGGPAALEDVASDSTADVVMAAIVGGAGLAPAFAAARTTRRLLLANKEALVMSGSLFIEAIRASGATLLPIDSEHNAIYQCLANGHLPNAGGVRKIWLTASGGPFLRKPVSQLAGVTPDEACDHPNWKMGRKISVDSATMMNKGLELIEACWLFGVAPERIEIVVHPQSIVHSMVEYLDGSILAQLGNPDMKTPIAHGLSWPERIESGVAPLDIVALSHLGFEGVEADRFPCLDLARRVAGREASLSIALNAANEVAVQAFLDELIRFTDIPLIIERMLEQTCPGEANTISEVLSLDEEARARSKEMLARISGGRT